MCPNGERSSRSDRVPHLARLPAIGRLWPIASGEDLDWLARTFTSPDSDRGGGALLVGRRLTN
jgi:hypothetical protein